MRALLGEVGFAIDDWQDVTAVGHEFFVTVVERLRTEKPPLGLHLVMGPDFLKMTENMSRNLAEDRIKLIEIVCHRG